MKKSTKILLTIALCLIGAGMALAVWISMTSDVRVFGISSSAEVPLEHLSREIRDPIHSIHIQDVESSIQLLPSADGICRVEYVDSRLFSHEIQVESGVLTITRNDTSGWLDRVFSTTYERADLKLYLTDGIYDTLFLESISGDIRVGPEFTFTEARVSSVSGSVSFAAATTALLQAQSISGNLELSGNGRGTVTADSTSGDILLKGLDCGNLTARSVSGSISGTTTTAKHFVTETVSGRIQTPESDPNAPIWTLNTISGDIAITAAP